MSFIRLSFSLFAPLLCVVALTVVRARAEELSPAVKELTLVWDGKGERPRDKRLDAPRTLHQGSGFVPPQARDEWLARAAQLRTQVLVAAGLWPLPERTPLNAVIHGKIDCGDYTVEKVFFESYPGFYVTGSLFRPAFKDGRKGLFPGVLCPHGHWQDGRFYAAPDALVKKQLAGGWEVDENSARYPLQARCANLARLGCVVFHYDMVGYADSDPKNFPHRATWLGAKEELNSLGVLGLQLWDSMRALDFLESLPDVDKKRLACTGASGGATQTFLLMATDDRLACAAPVCMLSADEHQGGCVCENAALLRVFTDNIEIAACFAPKPFIHPSATGDWTKNFMEQGLPEIKAVYRLFGAEDNVEALRQTAEHNYNLKSREAVYDFFNRRLNLGYAGPAREMKFTPLKHSELTVFDEQHRRPANALNSEQLKAQLVAASKAQLEALTPKDAEGLKRFRAVMEPALQVLCSNQKIERNIDTTLRPGPERADYAVKKEILFGAEGARVPLVEFIPKQPSKEFLVLIQPGGKAALVNREGNLLDPSNAFVKNQYTIVAPDLFGEGENASAELEKLDRSKVFFAGYNPTSMANRARDILNAARRARAEGAKRVTLVGRGKDGPACLLAAALDSSKKIFDRVLVDADNFDFAQVSDYNDERFLPGAAKFGGLWNFAALVAPVELDVFNAGKKEVPHVLGAAYKASNAEKNLHWAGSDPAPSATFIYSLLTK